MPDSDIRIRFCRLVQTEIACAERLLLTLEQEHQALLARDTTALERASSDKVPLLRELEQRLVAHDGFLRDLRLPPGKAGNLTFLGQLSLDAEEHGLWRRLQEIADTCRTRNERNGSILAASRARVQRSLEILRGLPEATRTYGKGGETRHSGRSQILGQA